MSKSDLLYPNDPQLAPETPVTLETCPFCDNNVELNELGDIDCPACGYTFYDTSSKNKWWNFRPRELELNIKIKQLEAEIYRLNKRVWPNGA